MHVITSVDPRLIAKVYNAFALVAKNIASMDVAFAIAINSLEIKIKMEMFDKQLMIIK